MIKGPISCIRDFVRQELPDAYITESKICTPERGKVSVINIVDMYYAFLRDNEDKYLFFQHPEIPLGYIKSEIKLRLRKQYGKCNS